MIKKVFLIFVLIIMLMNIINIKQVSACDNIITDADNFIETGENDTNNAIDLNKLKDASSMLYNTLATVGICIAVIIGAVLGIQFITGSVEQKAKIKDSLIPYVVGCVVIFGAFGIWRLVIILLK